MNAPTIAPAALSDSSAGHPCHLILGCGYTGLMLAEQLVATGADVVATTRSSERRAEISAAGAEPVIFDHTEQSLESLMLQIGRPLLSVTWLIPARMTPDRCAQLMRELALAVGTKVTVSVVVSTAIFGAVQSVITERTSPRPKNERGERWAAYDRAALYLRAVGYDFAVVRTPAIYGPGRDHRAKLLTGEGVALRPGKLTSRIHVLDLARLLRRMTIADRPPVLLACDESPSPTWRVMLEASRILGTAVPRYVGHDEAKTLFSPLGYEMRTGGHACRSVVRPWLGLPLRYPTFREGLRACLGM